MKIKNYSFIVIVSILLFSSATANADIFKWLDKEVGGAITGKRPPRIHPDKITINHKGKKRLELGANSAYVRVGSITVKTHQLAKRLTQAGCTIQTGGNIAVCAPDVLDREIRRIETSIPIERITINHNGKKRVQLGVNSFYIRLGDITIKTHQLRKRLTQAGCIYQGGNIVDCAPDVLAREIRRIKLAENGKCLIQKNRNANFYKGQLAHNYTYHGSRGMQIHHRLNINGAMNCRVEVACYFYFSNGKPLKDFNSRYRTANGNVSTGYFINPGFEQTTYNDLWLFMPYNELHMVKGKYNLKTNCRAFYKGQPIGSHSPWQYFTFTKS